MPDQRSPRELQKQTYVFDPRPRSPYRIAVNRYWDPGQHSTDPDALTLVFAHGIGSHKELWEPTLAHLYALAACAGVKLRDAWALDAPNHGDSAVLNDCVLERFINFPAWEDYARSIHLLLAGQGSGVDVDFAARRLVGVGHSLGAITLMLSTTYMPDIKFHSVVLAEPMIVRRPRAGELDFDIVDAAIKRKDTWPTREAALRYFQSSISCRGWDAEILEKYAEHGLRELPTAMYPDKTSGVTLKCHKLQQAATLSERQTNIRAYDYLASFCQLQPVHAIFGAAPDFLPRAFREDQIAVAAKGLYVTVSDVDGAGHFVMQMQPKKLAEKIRDALVHDMSAQSKSCDVQAKL
ncbi:hypothetical protein PHLGIDRAFT_110421 [Phlebiopsis gigantea 11061_1 CR5-6]|uniref:AB hydrolase-1 domain-containing protein n=1 Tax=Phlebiopsis gigantea (strain 11061_1 CR5-6) TaxID=745531 RepID=A0A0C3S2D6_PHLG1|nr:hypothetical protein PHLGIDRAFT_110421 [Phlebiopsis gigantea 11061_1 CR5-6]